MNGLSIKTSVDFLNFLKNDGRFLCNASLFGHTIKFLKISDRAFKYVLKLFEISIAFVLNLTLGLTRDNNHLNRFEII